VAFVYLAGLVQGVVMVSFAASSAVLRGRHGFSDTEYGSIFLPQVVLAALGAVGSGAVSRGSTGRDGEGGGLTGGEAGGRLPRLGWGWATPTPVLFAP